MKTCNHLAPLEDALAKKKIAVRAIESPYDTKDYRWFDCDCTFDATALRARLHLDACVVYDEYDGRVAGSEATFTCQTCLCVIMGPHPSYASKKTPRLA